MTARVRWCRHHRNPSPLIDQCAAGVDMDQMGRPFGWHFAMPCNDATRLGIAKITCASRSLHTDEDVAQQDADLDAAVAELIRRAELLAPLVRQIRRYRALSGTSECPVCGGPELNWSIDSWDRSVALRCETPGCVRAIE